MNTKPDWWPENPYPAEVFSMTVEDYVKAVPDPITRTAISGLLMRIGWDIASATILERAKQHERDTLL